MFNPIKRLYKPQVATRTVSLSVDPVQSAPATLDCEVVEYDRVTGMEQWNDIVFKYDFQDIVVTIPGTLFEETRPAKQASVESLDPYKSVGKNSA